MIAELLGERFVRLEKESDIELYTALKVLKSDFASKFAWHLVTLKELLQASLDSSKVPCKVSLGKMLTVSFILVDAYDKGVYVARMIDIETENLGTSIERKITSVSRPNANGSKRRDPRLVIEGHHLHQLDLVIGDKMDMFVQESSPDRDGYILLKPKKRLH